MATSLHTVGRFLPRSLRLTSLVVGGNLRLHRNAGDVPYMREPPIVAGKSVYKVRFCWNNSSFWKERKTAILTGAVYYPARPLRITQ